MQIELITIDPQQDFTSPSGSLYVPGGEVHCQNLARMLGRIGDRVSKIHITLDSHHPVDISHPSWWVDSHGVHPQPFTVITSADVSAGTWTTTKQKLLARSVEYLKSLEKNGRYPHVIWPYHCLIGSEGHAIHPDLFDEVKEWELRNFSMVTVHTKGSNPFTEHFSAVRAEVPDPADPTTQLNTDFVSIADRADIILLSGEARSHCLANTVRDFVSTFSDPTFVSKMVLLTDATGDVPGFENAGDAFLRDLGAMGMKVSTTRDFLA